jgi:hypothetical protein
VTRVGLAGVRPGRVPGPLWRRTPRWLPQVVLGLFLLAGRRAGLRPAARPNLLADRAGRG